MHLYIQGNNPHPSQSQGVEKWEGVYFGHLVGGLKSLATAYSSSGITLTSTPPTNKHHGAIIYTILERCSILELPDLNGSCINIQNVSGGDLYSELCQLERWKFRLQFQKQCTSLQWRRKNATIMSESENNEAWFERLKPRPICLRLHHSKYIVVAIHAFLLLIQIV